MLDRLTIDDFAPRVGERFGARAAGGRSLALTLVAVDVLPGPGTNARTPFSLEFCDTAPDYVPQQTVVIAHPELGTFDLFVVPLGPSGRGMRYEAIFT